MAHRLIHVLRESLAPGCLPLFTSDGLNLSFYAITAHFGHWREVWCHGHKALRWQVAAGLTYGQVKKQYRWRKLVGVTHLMRLGTEDALTVVLRELGLSGWLNTAIIPRVNLTIRDACGSSGKAYLGHRTAVPTPLGPSAGVARVVSFCAAACIPTNSSHAAARAWGQAVGAALPAPYPSHGSGKSHPSVDSKGSPVLPPFVGPMLDHMSGYGA